MIDKNKSWLISPHFPNVNFLNVLLDDPLFFDLIVRNLDDRRRFDGAGRNSDNWKKWKDHLMDISYVWFLQYKYEEVIVVSVDVFKSSGI